MYITWSDDVMQVETDISIVHAHDCKYTVNMHVRMHMLND